MIRPLCRSYVMALTIAAAVSAAPCAEHAHHIATMAAQHATSLYDRHEQVPYYDEESHLMRDGRGRLNLAESSLNYAAALRLIEQQPQRERAVIDAVLSAQEIDAQSPRCGLFPWWAGEDAEPDVDATMYLAPTLAYLALTCEDAGLTRRLEESAALALEALLSTDERPREGFGLAMWAGAVSSLGAAADDEAGQEEAAEAVRSLLAQIRRRGFASPHSPTFDALRIGGLRWAWQHAPDEEARGEAELALRVCYLDMLQRYERASAVVAGAMSRSYAADYLGQTGLARYLLACDLLSALAAMRSADPFAMYFALSQYAPPAELVALAEEREGPIEVRTRTPDPDGKSAESTSTCTWVAPGLSLGTMSGTLGDEAVPILATCDRGKRPTSYVYAFGAPATVSSAQDGPLAICSFNFDGVGIGQGLQSGLRGVLARRDEVDRVIIGRHEWIGSPEAVGQNTPIAVRRGTSYLGVKILHTGAGGSRSDIKPGQVSWLREGNMDSLMLEVYGREARYRLRKPLFDVRVGLLIEVAPASEYASLEEFAQHVGGRRVTQRIEEERVRLDRDEEIPGRHELKTRSQMQFVDLATHTVMLDDEELALGLTEELVRNRLLSRTLPVEVPEEYLWSSPSLELVVGAELEAALSR